MENTELLDNLLEDLGNINASRQAHQQIIRVLQSYKKGIENEEAQLEKVGEEE